MQTQDYVCGEVSVVNVVCFAYLILIEAPFCGKKLAGTCSGGNLMQQLMCLPCVAVIYLPQIHSILRLRNPMSNFGSL